eukprot:snap_masked-scaffold_4-processed-gene-7.37-mRNA-1 protein AED:1.00 eAED:1.00 QI:0/0/0/0/1/1/2/0/113
MKSLRSCLGLQITQKENLLVTEDLLLVLLCSAAILRALALRFRVFATRLCMKHLWKATLIGRTNNPISQNSDLKTNKERNESRKLRKQERSQENDQRKKEANKSMKKMVIGFD